MFVFDMVLLNISNLFIEVSSVHKSVLTLKVQCFGNCLIQID